MPQTPHVPFSISNAIKIQGGWYEKDLMKASTAVCLRGRRPEFGQCPSYSNPIAFVAGSGARLPVEGRSHGAGAAEIGKSGTFA